eukprot:1517815-Rhodomonas_salina.2
MSVPTIAADHTVTTSRMAPKHISTGPLSLSPSLPLSPDVLPLLSSLSHTRAMQCLEPTRRVILCVCAMSATDLLYAGAVSYYSMQRGREDTDQAGPTTAREESSTVRMLAAA